MTIQLPPKSKSKRRTKYRAVERQDGLIVLQRPYQPANSAPRQPIRFEKHLPIFETPSSAPSSKKMKKSLIALNNEHDFAHIGSHLAEIMEKDAGTHGVAETCGHDDVENVEKELDDILASLELCPVDRVLTPMQRFLSELGPWHPLRGKRLDT
jgi:hypothetical protein